MPSALAKVGGGVGGDDGKKKKRKTKKQIQREREAEAELARLAEIERLKQVEISEHERREQLKLKEIEDRTKRAEELERLVWERDQDASSRAERERAVKEFLAQTANESEWQRWIECDALPTARDEADLNAFHGMWAGDLEANSDYVQADSSCGYRGGAMCMWDHECVNDADMLEYEENVQQAYNRLLPVEYRQMPVIVASEITADLMRGCQEVERVIEKLTVVMAEAAQNVQHKRVDACRDVIRRLRAISAAKIDLVTAKILEQQRTPWPCNKKPQPSSKNNGGRKDEEKDAEQQQQQQQQQVAPDMLECNRTTHTLYGLWAHSSYEHARRKQVTFDECDATIDLPKALAMLKVPLCLRAIQTSYDPISSTIAAVTAASSSSSTDADDDVTCRSSKMVSVGGTFTLQQLQQPPRPEIVNNWVMREMTPLSTSVSVQPYKPLNSLNSNQPQFFRIAYKLPANIFLGLINNSNTTTTSSSSSSSSTQPNEDEKKPSQMGMLPRAMLTDGQYKITVGWWDAESGSWCTDGVLDARFEAIERRVIIDTTVLNTFAIIQPRALDFPYRSWSLMISSPRSGLFRLQGGRFTVTVGIEDDKCRLLMPLAPELAHLHDTPLEPGLFFVRLAECGINLMPTDADAQFAKKLVKQRDVELRTHHELSSVAGLFNMMSSKWNGSRPSTECVVELQLPQSSSSSSSECVSLVCDHEKVRLSALPSNALEYSPDIKDGHESHASVRRAAVAWLGDDAYQAAERDVSLPFQITVQRVFNLTRVFTFH